MASSNRQFRHRPLESLKHIRILRLLPGSYNDPLVGELLHVHLDHSPPYEAISYECGPPERGNTPKPFITISPDKQLSIRRSLSNALRVLRSPRHPRVLWADAICVNQSNTEEAKAEKTHQITKLFGKIYTNASRVVTYIGEQEPETEIGLQLATQILDYVERTLDFEPDPRLLMMEDRAMFYFNFPPVHHPAWRGLRSLLSRGWSSRTWIVQESLLNDKMLMHCGQIQIPWNTFPKILRYAEQRRIPLLALVAPGAFEMPSPSPLMNIPAASTNLHALSKLRKSIITKNETKTLLELLEQLLRFDTTDKRDKIYSLLAVASDQPELKIVADYNMSTEDAFTNATVRIIKVSRSLDVLANVKPNKSLSGLASWVPDWSPVKGLPVTALLYGLKYSTRHPFSATGESMAQINYNPNYQSITLSARVLDTIGYSSGVIRTRVAALGPESQEQFVKGKELLDKWYAKVKKSDIYGGKRAADQAFWRTLIGNITHERRVARNDYETCFRAWRSETWPDPYDSYADVDGQEAGFFGYALQASLQPRCFCMSSMGYACLTPAGTHIGDQICLLKGGRTPYVIKNINGRDTLLGEAYVHGLMGGEGVSIPGTHWESITLY